MCTCRVSSFCAVSLLTAHVRVHGVQCLTPSRKASSRNRRRRHHRRHRRLQRTGRHRSLSRSWCCSTGPAACRRARSPCPQPFTWRSSHQSRALCWPKARCTRCVAVRAGVCQRELEPPSSSSLALHKALKVRAQAFEAARTARVLWPDCLGCSQPTLNNVGAVTNCSRLVIPTNQSKRELCELSSYYRGAGLGASWGRDDCCNTRARYKDNAERSAPAYASASRRGVRDSNNGLTICRCVNTDT